MARPAQDEATPIRRQYLDIKRKYADCILFFRLGDFFETFDSDAELLARELDVVLTSRPISKDTRVPMAGVPHHAVDGYIARLIERGYRVAMADQIGSEAINGLVPREVKRVITPGTVVEPGMLDATRPSYLAATIKTADLSTDPTQLGRSGQAGRPITVSGGIGFAYCDITTGEFWAAQLNSEVEYERELARVQPRELLHPEDPKSFSASAASPPHPFTPSSAASQAPLPTPYPAYRFEISSARQTLLDHFEVSSLQGFDLEDKPLALRASGAILAYLRENQPSALAQLSDLRIYNTAHFMGLDAVTRRNLELTEGSRSRNKQGSLLGVLDKTQTAMGARLLRTWVAQPLLEKSAIEERLARVDALFADTLQRSKLREALKNMPDLERLTGRVLSDIASPKDLLHLKAGCEQFERLCVEIRAWRLTVNATSDSIADPQSLIPNLKSPTADLQSLVANLQSTQPISDIIDSAIKSVDEIEGDDGFIKPGFSPELDGIHLSARDAKTWVANLERVERERSGITSLKVGFNKVFGYYIEITHAKKDLVPTDYIRKQTLTNAERYITPQLKEYETLILNADERIAEIEVRLLKEINTALGSYAKALMSAAHTIARLDVAAALAEVAARNNYVRPHFNTEQQINIREGRHAVIEQLMNEVPYIPNDSAIDPQARVLVITGPNMSGKSSYMRQVALIVLMAQIGSYVPAQSASLCCVDRIFTRIGAQDELTAGQSTFMVEMVETANILRHCTPNSLVILDEIGRGTSTYDGLAIAWSVIEYLHNHPERRAMTLFATHYHELIQLAGMLPHVRNYNVAVSDEGGKIVFLHKVIEGGADRSYGVHVAQLAGLPPSVVHRAEALLQALEGVKTTAPAPNTRSVALVNEPQQLSMFAESSPVLDKLKAIDPNALSPLEALMALFELKRML